jgi:hypothetical protein
MVMMMMVVLKRRLAVCSVNVCVCVCVCVNVYICYVISIYAYACFLFEFSFYTEQNKTEIYKSIWRKFEGKLCYIIYSSKVLVCPPKLVGVCPETSVHRTLAPSTPPPRNVNEEEENKHPIHRVGQREKE